MTQTLSAPTTDFVIKRNEYASGDNYYTIQVVTVAGTSDVKDGPNGTIRRFSTRSSARKAITRLRRSLNKN